MENIVKLRKTAIKHELEGFDPTRNQHAGQQHLPPFDLIKDKAQEQPHGDKPHHIYDVLDQQEGIACLDRPIAPEWIQVE